MVLGILERPAFACLEPLYRTGHWEFILSWNSLAHQFVDMHPDASERACSDCVAL